MGRRLAQESGALAKLFFASSRDELICQRHVDAAQCADSTTGHARAARMGYGVILIRYRRGIQKHPTAAGARFTQLTFVLGQAAHEAVSAVR
jgi:hypothetical protein